MAKVFGGSASRLEVYALFVAAVVLIGGGVSGAIVLASNFDSSAPANVSTATTAPVEEILSAATGINTDDSVSSDGTELPNRIGQRIGEAAPVGPSQDSVAALAISPTTTQPILDSSLYCVMPDFIGDHNGGGRVEELLTTGFWGLIGYEFFVANSGGCLARPGPESTVCVFREGPHGAWVGISQDPAPGTLMRKDDARYSIRYGVWAVRDSNPQRRQDGIAEYC
jgi:hypothetical protein